MIGDDVEHNAEGEDVGGHDEGEEEDGGGAEEAAAEPGGARAQRGEEDLACRRC